MSDLLANIGLLFEWGLVKIGRILDVVISNPALIILVLAMPIVGFAFGLLHRLIRM